LDVGQCAAFLIAVDGQSPENNDSARNNMHQARVMDNDPIARGALNGSGRTDNPVSYNG